VRRVAILGLASLASLAVPLIAAQAPPPGQGGPQTPPTSTAVILGQVLDGSSNQPVAAAIVTLMGGAGPPGKQRVMTGADGRFVFHGLPPGEFHVSASLTGYSSNPSRDPSGGGLGGLVIGSMTDSSESSSASAPVAVPLTAGELATGVKLRLWKDAVVSGTVLDDRNEPAIGMMVQALRRVMAAGRAHFLPGPSVETDDRGAYRLTSLAPGDYIVAVPQTPASVPTSLMSGLIEGFAAPAETGRGDAGAMAIFDVMTSGVDPTLAMNRGARMGDYMVASNGSVPILGADGSLQFYQTAFYPGVSDRARASVVSLKSGEERSEVNFNLRLIRTSRMSGTAMGPHGPVANLGVRLVAPADGSGSESEFDVATAVTKSDGTFSLYGVPPGQFLLRAQKMPRPASFALGMSGPFAPPSFGGPAPEGAKDALFGTTDITVANSDVGGVSLQLTTGLQAIGRLEFESVPGRSVPTADQMATLTVTLTAVDGRPISAVSSGVPIDLMDGTGDHPNAEGEFRTRGYSPGKYFLSISGDAGWQIKAATLGGRDVLDAPLELRDRDAEGILVTLTDHLASVSGTVMATGDTDLSETSVYLFPSNYAKWIADGMNARRARTARASRTGTYALANVPAGEYLMAAIEGPSEGDMQDPAFIETLSRGASRVVVTTTDKVINLTTARGAR
jgi:hypothetical protein